MLLYFILFYCLFFLLDGLFWNNNESTNKVLNHCRSYPQSQSLCFASMHLKCFGDVMGIVWCCRPLCICCAINGYDLRGFNSQHLVLSILLYMMIYKWSCTIVYQSNSLGIVDCFNRGANSLKGALGGAKNTE